MKTEGLEQVVRRIDEARAAIPGGVVAFDGDGTLWSGDVGEDFFHAMLAHARFLEPACDELRRAAALGKVDVAGKGDAMARALYDAYRADRYEEERICELMAWGCAGWSRQEVDRFADDVVERGRLSARLQAEATRAVAWAKEAGLEVFLVSASPRAIVELAAKTVGVDADHVVAATPLYEADVMRADVDRPIPYGPGKVTRLRERIGKRPLYAAFGDNVFDIPMLREAHVPVAIRPKARLSSRAAEVPTLVTLQPIP